MLVGSDLLEVLDQSGDNRDNKKLSSWMPECLHKCQDAANKDKANKAPKDKKCAEHDFACHCIDYSHYSAVSLQTRSFCCVDRTLSNVIKAH